MRTLLLLAALLLVPGSAAAQDWLNRFASDACSGTKTRLLNPLHPRLYWCPSGTPPFNSTTIEVRGEARLGVEPDAAGGGGTIEVEVYACDVPQPEVPNTEECAIVSQIDKNGDGLIDATTLDGNPNDGGHQRRWIYGLEDGFYYVRVTASTAGSPVVTMTYTGDN